MTRAIAKHYQGHDAAVHTLLGDPFNAFSNTTDQGEAEERRFLHVGKHLTLGFGYDKYGNRATVKLTGYQPEHGFACYFASGVGINAGRGERLRCINAPARTAARSSLRRMTV